MESLDKSKLSDHDLVLLVHQGLEMVAKSQERMGIDMKEMKDGTNATIARLEAGKVEKDEYNRHLLEEKEYRLERTKMTDSIINQVENINQWRSRVMGALIILNILLGVALSIALVFLKGGSSS